MMNIITRQATEQDISLVISLLRSLYLELGEEASSVEFLDERLVLNVLQLGRTKIFLAMDNDIAVGIITISEGQAIYAGGGYGIIDEMYVIPGYRSQNIGAQLVTAAKDMAIVKGWKRIDVTTPTEDRWVRTVDFYKKSGFMFTGSKLKLNC